MINNYSKDLFESLITRLNQQHIQYAIIGDYQNLPDFVNHDIDIWTADLRGFRAAVYQSVKETKHYILIDNETNNGFNIVCYRYLNGQLTFMKIDVLVDTSYKSTFTLVDKEDMGKYIMPYKNFFVARPEIEALMHFLYPHFEWGKLKKECYKKEILHYCMDESFLNGMMKLWSEKDSRSIIEFIESERWREIEKQMPALKRKALFKALFKSNTYINVFKTLKKLVKRFFSPSGKCVAFCGLDGAGKTTILDELNKVFVNLLKSKKVFYGYWRPYVLPEIRELLGKKNSKSGICKEEQKGLTIVEPEKKTKNKFFSLIKALYFWVDYLLAPLKYGKIRSLGGIVLFDRHYVDMVVFPQRFEMNVSRRLLLFLYRFIPKVDYTFFLYCTPDEILKRKQEFSKEEIEKQIELYNEVGKRMKNFKPIHTNTSLEEEINNIIMCMIDK